MLRPIACWCRVGGCSWSIHPPRNRIARHLIDALTGPEMANSDLVALRGLFEGAGFEVVDIGVRSVAFGYVLGRKP